MKTICNKDVLRRALRVSFALAFSLLFSYPAAADQIFGKVIGIADGDTITILTDSHKQIRVRLAEIDAPEKSQPWGQNAKQALSGLIFGRTVKLDTRGTDQYGRMLARIYSGSQYINAEMVRRGDAWAYQEYLTDYSLVTLENQARRQRTGLWSLPTKDVVPPWQWRRGARSVEAKSVAPSETFQCGTKRYCRQMTSCAEARFYLQKCGVTTLDGDHDGIPCEVICR
jgi:endonuclease YncB( thermonuclease family)